MFAALYDCSYIIMYNTINNEVSVSASSSQLFTKTPEAWLQKRKYVDRPPLVHQNIFQSQQRGSFLVSSPI